MRYVVEYVEWAFVLKFDGGERVVAEDSMLLGKDVAMRLSLWKRINVQ